MLARLRVAAYHFAMKRAVPPSWFVSVGVLGILSAASFGCTNETPDYTLDADTGSTNALVTIERSTQVHEPFDTRAEAFAGFLQAPPEVDPAILLKLTGLSRELPSAGQCSNGREHGRPALAPLSSVELLDVGDLNINAGRPTTLAPRAFPTVTDLISGVVYTTRDRDPERLPAATSYQVQGSGGSLQPFNVQADAPAELESVTVDGAPIADLTNMSARSPFSVSWVAGASRDVVYLEITGDSGQRVLLCAYEDTAGSALIPAGVVPSSGHGTLGIHRLRSVPFSVDGLTSGELRFDFEVVADVDFRE